MRQFLSGNDTAFHELEERAKRACIRFRGQEMPPGSIPQKADIGFEVDQGSGLAKLLVSLGVRYRGPDLTVQGWLTSGTKEFSSFQTLVEWIRGPLADVYNGSAVEAGETKCYGSDNLGPHQITDISAVHEAIREIHRPLFLEEDELHEKLKARVLGQDSALKALAAVMVRHCARRKPIRPAVVFAVGPSGVGKTRTAEVLAEVFRGMTNENGGYQFLRLDMTEYQEAHRISQLIGAPQGYVGHGDGSQLIDALRDNPHTILLFDEIEKAHPAILRVLMNAMDAGRLSTANRYPGGREIDCRQSVFMFTSNFDAREILDELDTRKAFGNRVVEDEVCRRRLHAKGIAPEVIGRIGCFLVYRPLSPETRAEIMLLAISEVAEEYGLRVSYIEPGVIVDLMEKCRSQSFGVRPERFLIDDALGGAFANAAQQRMPNPVDLVGPPYECKAHAWPAI